MNKLKWIAGLAVIGAAAALTAPAQALNIGFDEGATAQTGTLSYDGVGGAMQGRNLQYTTILGTDTPANSGVAGVLTCIECFLNFDTGANISEGPVVWTFAGGGFFTLTGTVRMGGIGGVDIITNDTILTGSFVSRPLAIGQGSSINLSAFGIDEKNVALTDYFGIPDFTEWQFSHTEVALNSCAIVGAAFDCDVLNTDLQNIAVPVPAPLALLGLGLLGLGFSVRGKRRG